MDPLDFQDPNSFSNKDEEISYWKNATYNARDAYVDSQLELETVQKQLADASIEAIKSSLHDAQAKVKGLSQTNEVLMSEVKSKQLLVEEMQRLKDELRDMNVELGVLKSQKSSRISRASLGGPNFRVQNTELADQNKSFKEVMDRMKGLESKIENARSMVSPLLQESRKYTAPISKLNAEPLVRSRTIGGSPVSNRRSMMFEPKFSEHIPRKQGEIKQRDPQQFPKKLNFNVENYKASNPPKDESIPVSNFTFSSESSRLRMARSRANKSEIKPNISKDKDELQTVPN
ncbi:hypothetical protein AYI68_g4577 [Smittium mucronatum]|uniref:Nuclear distribution protein nudE-like protein n=1 Tax=Smittium mucronatum TaxID=133383 RepID=A0A1R0GWU5_9FUNG|nr:hypothetical protein AYI68_g4577 [Smittium mucronatum]